MDVDVLVVGYGPVGAALAGLLGGYGVRTLVIDKAPDIYTAPRAIALDNEALRILQMVGLGEHDFARVPIPFVALRSPRFGEFARIRTARVIDGHPMLVTFFQPELERALRANAERKPSVTAQSGVELLWFTEDAEGVHAVIRTAHGDQELVRARYLVGADGASSKVRAAIGESFEGQTYAEDWLIVDALDVESPIDHVEFHCDPERPTPHMLAPGGRQRWEFMLRPGEVREEMERDETIAELLAPWVKPGAYRVERKAVYQFHARVCARFRKGRVLLAGDAAHVTPPFVGQGLVSGLRDAANLAWKLAWVTEGRAAPSLLESYDRERRPHAKKMVDLARFAGLFIMPRSRTRAFVTHGMLNVLRHVPGLKTLIGDFSVKPMNAYSEGLFVRGRGRIPRGSWFPQAVLRDAHGRARLSDEVIGRRLTLICTDASPSIDAETARRWERAGGATAVLLAKGSAPSPGCHVDVEGAFHALTRDTRCIVVRPDLTVLHDGPLSRVGQVVRESLSLLTGGLDVAST